MLARPQTCTPAVDDDSISCERAGRVDRRTNEDILTLHRANTDVSQVRREECRASLNH
jgi:hypothetical protein